MKNHSSVTESPAFKKLIRNRLIISLFMTLLICLVYFGFIFLIAFNKNSLTTKVVHSISIEIIVGISIIFFAWILTGVYVFWANRYYDKWVQDIKNELPKNSSK